MISDRFDETHFQLFSSLLDSAMEGIAPSFDERMFLEKYDTVMTELGILPIAANMLPEGDSVTL
ncbi:MAG: hypothetical protein EAX95_02400 [Candidatus Thorarchaeota archaeon]|nr:hypothetical protein [Candidatus Thorarchaeota archaeon]